MSPSAAVGVVVLCTGQYGHGLFGDQKEVLTQYLQDQANEFGVCAVRCFLVRVLCVLLIVGVRPLERR
jgi:hypothetical protein